MAEQVLNVTGLAARVEDKQLLHGVDLTINKGETHVLMGPNGAGKSTLGYVLMGAPKYTVTGGQILFKGEDITHESTDKRAKAGMFLSFPGAAGSSRPDAGRLYPQRIAAEGRPCALL